MLKARRFDHDLSQDEVDNALNFELADLEATAAIAAFNVLMPEDTRLADLKTNTKCPPEVLEWASELLSLNLAAMLQDMRSHGYVIDSLP